MSSALPLRREALRGERPVLLVVCSVAWTGPVQGARLEALCGFERQLSCNTPYHGRFVWPRCTDLGEFGHPLDIAWIIVELEPKLAS